MTKVYFSRCDKIFDTEKSEYVAYKYFIDDDGRKRVYYYVPKKHEDRWNVFCITFLIQQIERLGFEPLETILETEESTNIFDFLDGAILTDAGEKVILSLKEEQSKDD